MSERNNEQKPFPLHVVIIPDGNRRWATDRGLNPWDGHEAGAQMTEEVIRKAHEIGIDHLSFWGSSLENLKKRPLLETKALLKIYENYFTKLSENEDIHANETKINFIGRWEEQFPEALKAILYRCIEKTKTYAKRSLNFFLAYNGDDEMLSAIRSVASKYGQQPDDINASVVKDALFTRELPSVDLLIRTGGEPHLSAGFMMWDIANAQLFFSTKHYPDFNGDEFALAIEDYRNRGRRFGK